VYNSVDSCSSIVYLNRHGISSYMSVLNVSMNTYKERRNQMEIQIITETKAIYMPFAPVNKLSADEYNEMRKMLAEAEALGVIRDWSIY